MIHRNKIENNNPKQTGAFSPIVSPRSKKKTIINIGNNNKLSPKTSIKQNKQNKQDKNNKSRKISDQNYFKIPKQGQVFQSKTSQPKKPLMTISIDDNCQNFNIMKEITISNYQTPKFKCSNNKLDNMAQKQLSQISQNYYSFGDQFKKSISLKITQEKQDKKKPDKKNLMQKFKPNQQQDKSSHKSSFSPFRKKQKIQKLKQNEHRFERKFIQIQKSMNDNKIKRDEDYFYFRK